MKQKIATVYSKDSLERERPQTLSDYKIESLIQDVLKGMISKDISDKVYEDFKLLAIDHITNSKINTLSGFEAFKNIEIINGCTHFIDNLYMKGKLQVLDGDYRYHQRLNPHINFSKVGNLSPNIPLIISLPFPSLGDVHPDMNVIIEECRNKNIDIHIDGAWITCSRFIDFNFNQDPIKSVGISLSKGLGLGWNRIGLRWTKEKDITDAISIMNDFSMNNRALVIIANYFLKNLDKDYLWTNHEQKYVKVCKDFNLTHTKSIHLAMHNNQPVGIAPLIRYLETNGI